MDKQFIGKTILIHYKDPSCSYNCTELFLVLDEPKFTGTDIVQLCTFTTNQGTVKIVIGGPHLPKNIIRKFLSSINTQEFWRSFNGYYYCNYNSKLVKILSE